MKKLVVFIITFIHLLGCSLTPFRSAQSNNPYSIYIYDYEKSEIDSIIQHNEYTLIYAWTEWCTASKSQLIEYLAPFLEEKPENIGIVSICCANSGNLIGFLEENNYEYPVYLLSGSIGVLDKWRLNRSFHALFDCYKSVDYVPIVLLCDKQKQILNWDSINACYDGVGTSIIQIKNNITFP